MISKSNIITQIGTVLLYYSLPQNNNNNCCTALPPILFVTKYISKVWPMLFLTFCSVIGFRFRPCHRPEKLMQASKIRTLIALSQPVNLICYYTDPINWIDTVLHLAFFVRSKLSIFMKKWNWPVCLYKWGWTEVHCSRYYNLTMENIRTVHLMILLFLKLHSIHFHQPH